MRIRIGIASAAAILLLAATAFGHGGGGGGHGGGGGGHGGGFGGGGFHGGGFHSGGMYSGGMVRSGTFNSGSMMRSGTMGTHATNQATFLRNNFSSGAMTHSVNRVNTGAINALHTNGKSFIQNNGINTTSLNHWTHNAGHLNNLTNHNNFKNFNNFNNFNHHHNNFFFVPFFGFGAWGLWWPYYLFGYGYGLGGYGYGYPCYGYNYYGYGNYGYDNSALPAQTDPTTGVFADQGEVDFKAGKYQAAARDWQHALIDDPKNGAIVMLMAQTLFALGQYDEAAGATQAAMQMLPEDKWGVVVTNYSQLYGNIQDYTDQLRALEKARDAKPDDPAIRFLLGFHFGYLGYPKQAVRELDKAMTLAPKDLGSRKIREIFAAKLPDAPPPPALPADDAAPGDAKPAGEAGDKGAGQNQDKAKSEQVGTPS